MLLVCLSLAPVAVVGEELPFVVYYGAEAPVESFAPYGLVVLDGDRHPPLLPLAAQGKTLLGYLSLGEVAESRRYFESVRDEGLLLRESASWKGSFLVDVRLPRWRERVVEELAPALLAKGFDGLFLDTLDDAPALEEEDEARYRGMTAAAAELVLALRERFPDAFLAMNRGYALLPAVEAHIDAVLGECLRSDYDVATGGYVRVEEALYLEQVALLEAARRRVPDLEVWTLDYWDPDDTAGIARIYREQRARGFAPYVATLALDRIVPEPPP